MSREYVQQRIAEFDGTKPSKWRDRAEERIKAEMDRRQSLLRTVHANNAAGVYDPKAIREIEKFRLLPKEYGPYTIHADAWTGPELPALSAADALALPAVTRSARRPGVYFLFFERELQYIGSSRNVRSRVTNHDCYKTAIFDAATYLAVAWPWHLALEAHFIHTLAPPLNSSHRNRP